MDYHLGTAESLFTGQKAFSSHTSYRAVQVQHTSCQVRWYSAVVSEFKGFLSLPGWLWELIASNVESFGEGI